MRENLRVQGQKFSRRAARFLKKNLGFGSAENKAGRKSISGKKLISKADRLYDGGDDKSATEHYLKYLSLYEKGKIKQLRLRAAYRADRHVFKIIHLAEYKLAYVPLPKCASTTLKHFVYELENGKPYSGQQYGIHKYYGDETNYLSLDKFDDYFLFTVVRDPLQRFVSAYKNRILHHGDFGGISKPESINEFAANIEIYTKKSKTVARHFLPQSTWLGTKFDRYDEVYDISEIDQLTKKLNTIANSNVRTRKLQTGGRKLSVEKLSASSIESLAKFYTSDFELLKTKYDYEDSVRNFAEKFGEK